LGCRTPTRCVAGAGCAAGAAGSAADEIAAKVIKARTANATATRLDEHRFCSMRNAG
jgi:hypothetical protein